MSYGARLYDENGRLFADVGIESYHYWGRIDFTPGVGYQEVSVFNIPTSVPVSAFLWCNLEDASNWGDNQGAFYMKDVGGRWVFGFRNGPVIHPAVKNTFKSGTLFVFVPARHIPQDDYGMQLFNGNGVRVFDSARPLLQIAGLANPNGQGAGTVTAFNRALANVAAPLPNESGGTELPFPNANYHVNYVGCRVAGLGGYYWLWDLMFPSGVIPPSHQPRNVAVIDADYYRNFYNLPPMA